MKIYLLSIDGRRCFFYADESEPPDVEDGAGPGSRGWLGQLADRWHRLQTAWDRSEARPVRGAPGLGLDALLGPPGRVDAVAAAFRRRIELHHPVSRDPGEVRKLWDDYLNHRWWRHMLWMSANAIVAPPGLLILWVLPGPNVIGYWFAYRAIHHALIVWGIYRLRRDGVPIELRPLPRSTGPSSATRKAGRGMTPSTATRLAWTSTWPGPRASRPLRTAPRSREDIRS